MPGAELECPGRESGGKKLLDLDERTSFIVVVQACGDAVDHDGL
jgi:hypothetical protein